MADPIKRTALFKLGILFYRLDPQAQLPQDET